MRYFFVDSRNKLTRTLPMVWFCLLVVGYMTIAQNWSATDFMIAMSAPLTLWGHREHIEKRKNKPQP